MQRSHGACISGELRSFLWPCVSEQMRINLLIPLNLRTHVFIHGPNVTDGLLRAALRGVNLGIVSTQPPQTAPPCPVRGTGYVITHALYECWTAIRHDTQYNHEWVFRLRSDHVVPFRLSTVPSADAYYAQHAWADGVALTSSLAHCNCGWANKACTSSVRVRCGSVDDQFAMLHGSAVRAYLHDLHVHFCNHGRLRTSSAHPPQSLSSENRLARMLSHRNITLHDVRFISHALHPRLQRMRGYCGSPADNRRPAQVRGTLKVPPRSLRLPLPDGPWDQRRITVCSAQRALARDKQHLCLEFNGTWDDDLFGPDARKRMRAEATALRA